MQEIAKTPEPPYYVVIFSSVVSEDTEGYEEMAEKMAILSTQQPGFLGMEYGEYDGLGITTCYWESLEAIAAWKENAEHKVAQALGKEKWYKALAIRVGKIERDSFFGK